MIADELIRSGLLEAYVLGQCAPDEAALVERMRASDASVRAELDSIELALETQAMANAVAPASAVKTAIMQRIAQEPAAKSTPVIPIQREQRSFNRLAAASVAALVLSAAMNFMQYRELGEVRDELAQLQNDRSVLAEEMQVLQTNLKNSQDQMALLRDTRLEPVLLQGMGALQGKRVRVYYDKSVGVVFCDPLTLPSAPEGKQYQLWAQVNGRMVDAGLVGLGSDTTGLQRMKDIPSAEAFAVSIERAGGSPTPTLTAVVLIGPV